MHDFRPPVLDEEALARLAALDPCGKSQLLARVLQAFEASAVRLVPQLEAARVRTDLAVIRHVTHTLKSSSASIGAAHLAELCGEVEALARDARTATLDERVEALIAEAAVVRSALREIDTVRP